MNQGNQSKLFFRKNLHLSQLRFASPKRSRNEPNPFVYLSPKARVLDQTSYRNYLSLTTQRKIIKVTQQNMNLRVSLRQTKLSKKKIDIQNSQLRNKLNSYNQEIQRLRKDCEDVKNCRTRDSIFLQENNSSSFLEEFNDAKNQKESKVIKKEKQYDAKKQEQFKTMKEEKQYLQNTLKDSNTLIHQLNNQIEKSKLGVWLLHKRLDQKMKELAKIKAQKEKKKIFQLSSDQQEQRDRTAKK